MTTKFLDTPSIPLIDLSLFSTGTPSQRQKAAKSLTEACQTLGFAYITGHGISPSLLQEAFAWSKKLYDLPHEEKMKAPHPAAPMPHRGYSAAGLEKVYSKKAQEAAEVTEGGASLRKIRDHKVWHGRIYYDERRHCSSNVSPRKASRSAARRIPTSRTSGCQRRSCPASELS